MHRRRPVAKAAKVRSCLLRAVLACAYLGVMIGLPIRSAEPHGRPFPCQGHQCACRTADECWGSCCCFSLEQRSAWAVAHNVESPEGSPDSTTTESPSALACSDSDSEHHEHACAAEHDGHDKHHSCDKHTSACCKHEQPIPQHGVSDCCKPRPAVQPASAAGTADTSQAPGATAGKTRVPIRGYGFKAQRCGGATTMWLTTGAVTPPPDSPGWNFDWASAGAAPSLSLCAIAVYADPVVPPPRRLA